MLAVVDTPPPPKTVTEPRGLGTMTARAPGTTAVVDGVRLSQHHVRAVVRDPAIHARVCAEVSEWVSAQGWRVVTVVESPVTGPEGNVEFLIAAEHESVAAIP